MSIENKILDRIERHQILADKYKAEYDEVGIFGDASERAIKWIAYRSNLDIVSTLKELLEDE